LRTERTSPAHFARATHRTPQFPFANCPPQLSRTALAAITRGRLAIADGLATPPDTPGMGISWDWDAIDNQRIM
jgi:L-alanine-DL-glutamate epimerase-like enolase superfamily enzyme